MGAERSEGPSHQLRDPQTRSPVPSLSAQSLPDSHFGVWMESCHPQPGSSRCSVPGPGPPGTSDPKPFPASQQHRLLVAPPLPSYLPPDFVLGVLLSPHPPLPQMPLNVSHPLLHLYCPGWSPCSQGQPRPHCYKPMRTPYLKLSHGGMSPSWCCPVQDPARGQSRDCRTKPQGNLTWGLGVSRQGQPQFPHLSAVSRILPSATTEGSKPC